LWSRGHEEKPGASAVPRQLKLIKAPSVAYCDRDAVKIGELYRDARATMADERDLPFRCALFPAF
jgi:hypothetical protein